MTVEYGLLMFLYNIIVLFIGAVIIYKVINRNNTLLDFFVNEYNQELLIVFSAAQIEENGYALSRDGSSITGGYNLAGTINTNNNYSGAGSAVNGVDLSNELNGFIPPGILEEIL